MTSPAGSGSMGARVDAVARGVLVVTAIAAVTVLVLAAGWEDPGAAFPWLETAARATLAAFGVAQFGRFAASAERRRWLRKRWPALALAVLALVEAVEFTAFMDVVQALFPGMSLRTSVMILLAVSQTPVLIDLGLRFLRWQEVFAARRVSPGAVLMLTFAALIAAGTGLLMLPRATSAGISWLDALFTSTSAVCVTGLIVVDTEAAFTPTGHVFLLVLIQLGGLGVMTLTTFLAQLFGGVSLRSRVLLQDLISEENLGRISRTLPMLLAMVVVFEAAGAWALHGVLGAVPDDRGGPLFSAVFHSVSAFCNAGFSIWSEGLHDPLVRGDAVTQVIVMILIVAGGMGFPVMYATAVWLWQRLGRLFARRSRRPVLSLHARLAWLTTAVLIGGGAVAIGLAEYVFADQPRDTPAVVASLFHSITARTAGFNIAPVDTMTPAAVSVLVLLMFIGGCPASTAGGVKSTAFAVALLNVRRILLGRHDIEIFGRRLPEEVVSRALAVVFLSAAWVGLASTLLAMLEPRVPLSDLAFEVVSAISTVGLSRGVTPMLGPAAKVVIILTMFAGRIGVLYFIFAFLGRRGTAPFRLPEENVLVT